ncbi:hypothetical protein N7509_008238 [Penicillium cosmopolitanum]|uniref:Intradiol ring-cleavage dioxygenases domain-containing protein n=1 Tax=Penicillium cosmopolitanum TaxID=1131564 RepID=A0A9W9VM64_9EURO|nr:uncharacterized protein N7509_008238 [Penicillium cosmopolitanum]KAJ5385697.1 hypothetical protein N7509_008238 [Penicillium cosmopolitanum]
MSFTTLFVYLLSLLALVAEAHPPKSFNPNELATHAEVKNRCGPHVVAQKRSQRALRRRGLSVDVNDRETTYEIHASAPKYDFIKNWTNILTPESSDGPYFYPRSQSLRQDIREGQPGVPCPWRLVWSTSIPVSPWKMCWWIFGSFTGLSPNTPFMELYTNASHGGSLNITEGLPDLSWLATDNTTFLRGMWPTNKQGVTSFTTIFPGFYVERAIHIHVQVHTNWSVVSNGTISHGPIVSTGQIFIDETLEKEIMAIEPYASHTQIERVPNDIDGIYTTESITGAMTLLDTEPLDGVDYRNGVIGYITLGVDPSSIKNGSTVNAAPAAVNLTALGI